MFKYNTKASDYHSSILHAPPYIAPYAKEHESPNGPCDARPTALQAVRDLGMEGILSKKAMLITGGSSGIGIEMARALHATGAKIFITTRSEENGKSAVDQVLRSSDRKDGIEAIVMDNESLASVRAAAEDFLTKSPQLNVLITNAGVMATPESRTKDGFEMQFGVNHLAHFYLFQLLRPAMLKSSKPGFASSVVVVSSEGHRNGPVQFDNINLENGKYNPWLAYGKSKTATIYMANYIERHFGSQGLHANPLNPGGISSTGLYKNVDPEIMKGWQQPDAMKHAKSPEQGANTSVWAAIAKDLEGVGGQWLEDCQTCGLKRDDAGPFDIGYAHWAFDDESEERLWKLSNELVGFKE
ncbi:WW domain-containing oxidoreductase [Rhizodiscina lignyota]|uniref:WW domain-containing oxidoreductase n=1 Tax=Rhizodiscina lignyota TaxID=1504668 RepID=A0A9P4M196_9PEZI|nr:WW domain-containing oxidoreductase [Rhizodiscina lignyota]